MIHQHALSTTILKIALNTIISYSVYYQGKTYYDRRMQNGKTTQKIYDIGMKYVPDKSDNKTLLLIIDLIPILLPLLILWNSGHIKDYYYILGNILLIRLIFTTLTILPKNKKCDDSEFTIKNAIWGHCYDKIFSGHFASVFLVVLFVYKYKIFTDRLIMILFLISYAILIISVRYNYTIDIAVAFIVTELVFNYYMK